MPDRRRRAAFRFPLSTAPSPRQGGIGPAALPATVLPEAVLSGAPRPVTALPAPRVALPAEVRGPAGPASRLLRERRSRSPETEDNPFAPPPEDRPDQPWRPRGPQDGGDAPVSAGTGGGNGEEGRGGGEEDDAGRSSWDSQWSSRQPRPQDGGFGMGPGFGQRQNDGDGPDGGPGGPGGLRWDPTDPVQRRARYALLAGMWGFFFSLFSVPEIGLLLGALAVYWGISSLRGKPAGERTDAGPAPNGTRPQTSAAVSGLITGIVALSVVAATFAFQFVYRDYFTCVDDALTYSSRQSCEHHLPKELRPLLQSRQ